MTEPLSYLRIKYQIKCVRGGTILGSDKVQGEGRGVDGRNRAGDTLVIKM